ncbi:dihydrolipoyl dehydrogenase [Paracoccus aerius]|uniref:Dihydrolipoyl dehydrogenase n=1 Tax=Paracoccus aerius TaxID=1915382 RepID=A0ABS1S0X1_9RHOB|nr:dihydrolipoyl dehydrogenase [Paracoccus aerius]MBL3672350.1 dihydrolipoyl dehydrogenase [Paracoccus aerius]GHG10705.1 dihydrolipoyl dehydrogenase [Paracoccus aerius]
MNTTAPDLSCDVAIIGAGTAGLAAERAARGAGATTLLIDDGFAGTLCANTGCMPSKLLIAAARAHADLDRARMMGIDIPAARVVGRRVMQRLRAERDRFVGATKASLADMPDGICIDSRAQFIAPDRLRLADGRTVAARAVVIATGARPVIPEPYRDLGPRVLTNETVFELEDLPQSMAVVGAGPLGAELAQAFARLGVRVALFDEGDRLAKIRCDKVHSAFRDLYARDVALHLGGAPTPSKGDRGIRLEWDGGAEDFDHVLVATGRAPALDGLALEAAGLELDDKGVPRFDRNTMQCGGKPIFIAGDADADAPVLHEASLEGAIAGRNAARFPDIAPAERPPLFTITFTDPPLAAIGIAPDKDEIAGFADYGDQGRAKVEGKPGGLMRIGADAQGRLVGADLAVPGAEHLAHLLVATIMNGGTARDLLDIPFYHPTLEEGMKPALRAICKAAGLDPSPTRDSGNPPGA